MVLFYQNNTVFLLVLVSVFFKFIIKCARITNTRYYFSIFLFTVVDHFITLTTPSSMAFVHTGPICNDDVFKERSVFTRSFPVVTSYRILSFFFFCLSYKLCNVNGFRYRNSNKLFRPSRSNLLVYPQRTVKCLCNGRRRRRSQ